MALLLLLALATFWLLRPAPAPADLPAAASSTAANAAPSAATAADKSPDSPEVPGRTTVPPAADTPTFEVRGRVLADARVPLVGSEILVCRGSKGEGSGFVANLMMANMSAAGSRPGAAAAAFLAPGDVQERVPVAADGTFLVRTHLPDLRLWLEHDFYGLRAPEIVHLTAREPVAEVWLSPFVGGCLRGRLLGADCARVQTVRLLLEPDPLVAVRDLDSYFGAT